MGLKKFSDFASNKVDEACGKNHKKEEKPKEESTKKEEPVKKVEESIQIKFEPKVQAKVNNSDAQNWTCKRTNNIVEFAKITKPSDSFKYLNENKEYKDLHYVLSEQPNNCLSVFRYNQNEGVNMKEFADSLFIHYRKNQVLNKVLENSSVEGNELFVIIKNLPDEKFINIVKKDLTNLLKNK